MKSNRLLYISVLMLSFVPALFAQNYRQSLVSAIINGANSTIAMTGGLNNPQFCEVDLNNDGLQDLLVFDREGNKKLTFTRNLSTNPQYVYAPKYETKFLNITDWVVLHDFNRDGVKDMFTYQDGGVDVYKGSYVNNEIQYAFFKTDLLYPINGIPTAVYISNVDYPSFVDVDNDGDSDLLTFAPAGGYVEWYKNTQVENGWSTDSLQYVLQDACWGKFYESGIRPSNNLNITCPNIREQAIEVRHPGSTLLAVDLDNDGDKELMLGDVSFSNIVTMYNGGSPSNALMTSQDTTFPAYNVPAVVHSFPGMFLCDYDHDNDKDLLVSPNGKNYSENKNVVWLYKNIMSDAQPKYELQQQDFLVGNMFDFGTGALATMVDVNADGLKDIVVGNYGYYTTSGNFTSRLALLLNIGTPTNPMFQLTNDNFLNIPQYGGAFRNLCTTFGDLDADGDLDMLFGVSDGTIQYLRNNAGAGQPMSFGNYQANYFLIDVGQFATPQLIDMDNDGDLDLVVGEQNGNINFYRNVGTPSVPNFTNVLSGVVNNAEIPNLGLVSTSTQGLITGYSVPHFYKEGGVTKLVVGSQVGGIFHYTNIDGNLNGAFTKETERFENITQGTYTSVTSADMDGDGVLEFIVGNQRGGLALYSKTLPDFDTQNTGIADIHSAESICNIFPNPANGILNMRFHYVFSGVIACADMSGKLLFEQKINGENFTTLHLQNLANGIYFLKITNNSHQVWQTKLVKQ